MADMSVIIEGSGRHIHVTREHLDILFGKGFELDQKKMLSQPGQFATSCKVTVTGPCGSIELDHGCIIAKRHIHMTPEDAERFGVKDKEIVQVKVGGERALIFDEVVCRVSPSYATFMHVDYDEINAASLFGKDPRGEIIKK